MRKGILTSILIFLSFGLGCSSTKDESAAEKLLSIFSPDKDEKASKAEAILPCYKFALENYDKSILAKRMLEFIGS